MSFNEYLLLPFVVVTIVGIGHYFQLNTDQCVQSDADVEGAKNTEMAV
jgi:hypothetical protein